MAVIAVITLMCYLARLKYISGQREICIDENAIMAHFAFRVTLSLPRDSPLTSKIFRR